MKVCETCGDEIEGAKDGENSCESCDQQALKKKQKAKQRKSRDRIMRDLGLVKVRGALGGVYYE